MKLITVYFACNDESGCFEGVARRVDFENVITLDSVSLDRPPRLAFIEFEGLVRLVRISGKVFPVRGYRNYTGNLCNSCVQMEAPVATAMLNFLKMKGRFNAYGGCIPASDAWFAEREWFSTSTLEAACL